MSSSLAKNTSFTLIANLSFAITNWLMLVVIAKTYDPAFLGQFVLVLSVVSPVFLFFSLKLRTLLIVDHEEEFKIEQYLGARLCLSSVALLFVVTIGLLFFENIPIFLFILIGLYKWCDAWSELFYANFQRLGRFGIASLSQACRSGISIVVILSIALITESPEWLIIGWLSVTAGFFIIDGILFSKLRFKLEQCSTNWLSLFLPVNCLFSPIQIVKKYYTLGFSLIVGALFVYIPNFVIEANTGIEAAGHFATVSYFLIAGGILINSLSQACTPKLSAYIKSNNYYSFTQLTLLMCVIGAVIGGMGICIAFFMGAFFLELFYNQEIAGLSRELVWVLIAAAIRYVYIFIGTAMNALKQFHIQTTIYTIGTLTVLIACLILVPVQGTLGAAKAMVIATTVELTLFMFFFRRSMFYRNKNHG